MKLNKAKPSSAGLPSQVQQAEMKLLLAGKWPALKPLPVFKFGTDEYRAEIYFERMRGEWVCRKTSLPSNEVQELRGGFKEITMALPHGLSDIFSEGATAEQHESESENEANRRLQAILDWKRNYENGALYSELQNYLSESQQEEIQDCIRMSLTAWQLQFNPKNVEFVFDALCNAGGRLATLIEIAKRNKAGPEPDARAQAEAATLEAEGQVPVEAIHPTRDQRLQTRATPARVDEIKPKQDPGRIPATPPTDSGVRTSGSTAEISIGAVPESQEAAFTPERVENFAPEPIKAFGPELSKGLTPEPVESVLPTTPENFPTEQIGSSSLAEVQASAPELIARAATGAADVASLLSLVAGLREKVRYRASVAGFGTQVRTDEVESPADRIEDSPSQLYASGISAKRGFGFKVGALVFLAVGFTIGFTVGLNTPPIPPETEESRSESQSAQSPNARPVDSAPRVRPTEPSSSVASRSDPSSTNRFDGATPSEEKPKESTQDFVSFGKVPSTGSNSSPTVESRPPVNPGASPEPNGSTGLLARNAPPSPTHGPAYSLNAVDQVPGAPSRPAPRRVTLATPRLSTPSVILVTAPAQGSKSLRVTFPEKPIAASSSFAITSQLSVLVSPEPGPAGAHKPARLQAGELVSYAWPRYPKPRNRYGSSETVKVRATIGRHGEVLDVKRVSGSTTLLPDAMGAIRQWHYKPTLLNKRPVKAQLDITIEFRPPQYLTRVSTSDRSPNY